MTSTDRTRSSTIPKTVAVSSKLGRDDQPVVRGASARRASVHGDVDACRSSLAAADEVVVSGSDSAQEEACLLPQSASRKSFGAVAPGAHPCRGICGEPRARASLRRRSAFSRRRRTGLGGGTLLVPWSPTSIIQLELASARSGSSVFVGVLTLVVGAEPSLAASRELELPQPAAANRARQQALRRTNFIRYPPP